MMKRIISGVAFGICLLVAFLLIPAPASALDMGLVSTLVNKLGVTEAQAQGGCGAIFKTAESRMSKDDYKQLVDEVPEVDSLQKYAPETKSGSNMLSSAASALGGKTGASLGGAADLLSSFKSLGMDKDMLGKFTPIIYDYVKKKGSEMAMSLLQKALTF